MLDGYIKDLLKKKNKNKLALLNTFHMPRTPLYSLSFHGSSGAVRRRRSLLIPEETGAQGCMSHPTSHLKGYRTGSRPGLPLQL